MKTLNELTLLYGTLTVGRISNSFCTDAIWYGDFEPTIKPADGELPKRLLDFIAFCKDWNERARNASGADAAEFDLYDDVIKSGLWATEAPVGERQRILDAPVFFHNGELSWRV